MTSYEPFLLPALLKLQANLRIEAVPRNALEEEILCLRLWKGSQPGELWRLLSPLLAELHGLPLYFASAEGDPPPRAVEDLTPDQALRLPHTGQPLFLLPHPTALPLFDRCAEAKECPVLVLPSLYRQMQEGLEKARPGATGPGATASGGPQAFFKELRELLRHEAPTDWHLEPTKEGYRSRIRTPGGLRTRKEMSREEGRWLVNMALAAADTGPRAAQEPVEGNFRLPAEGTALARDLRLSLVPSLHGDALVLRFLDPPSRPRGLKELGLAPPEIERLERKLGEREGMVLTAGPTGSGKSTTLHAFLRLAVEAGEKVLAVEDPVETRLAGVQQVAVDRERGLDFAVALRAFLRQSPDSLLVGEIRDPETASIAVEAARSGHRVYSSLHAGSSRAALHRLEDLGQTAESIRAVGRLLLHHRMAPASCPHCRQTFPAPASWAAFAREMDLPAPEFLSRNSGCPECREGLAGWRPLFVNGNLTEPEDTRQCFLRTAWNGILDGRLPPAVALPFLPNSRRKPFSRLPCVSSL